MQDVHSVRQARFEVRGGSEMDEIDVLHRLEGIWQTHLLPALETGLDELAPVTTVELARLEIDLGRFALDDPPPMATLQSAVRRALHTAMGEVPDERAAARHPPLEAELLEFLETGTLGWRAPDGLEAIERRLMDAGDAAPRLVDAVRALLGRAGIRRRIRTQLSPRFGRWLAEGLARDLPGNAALRIDDALAEAEPLPSRSSHAPRADDATSPESPTEARPDPLGSEHHAFRDTRRPEGAAPTIRSPLYVTGAGLPLLHPFMPRLLERVGLVQAGAFVDDDARERAVHLFAHVMDGGLEHAEPDLVVPKLLCGFELPRAIGRCADLTETELRACEALLEAAIEHWRQLKHTSRATFVETFLCREGRLEERPREWRLSVDRSPVDVLLDSVPWTIDVVQLSWMPRPVHVEWCR